MDRVQGSAFHNMQELRCSSSGSLRVLFAFDPRQQAVLLLGGDRSGDWDAWYDDAIPAADGLSVEYLRELRREGTIDE